MSQADVSVVSELLLKRDRWTADLQSAKAEYTQFTNELAAKEIKIQVWGEDHITQQVEEIIRDLSTREVVIPVRFEQVGGMPQVGSFAAAEAASVGRRGSFNLAEELAAAEGVNAVGGPVGPESLKQQYTQFLARQATMPPVEPYEINEFSGGGAFALAATGGAVGATAVNRGMGMSQIEWAERRVPTMADIESASDEADAAAGGSAAMERSTPGESRGGGMRGLRLFMAAHIAMRGTEAAYNSYETSHDLYELAAGKDEGTLEGLKRSLADTKKQRSGFSGLTGIGEDALAWAMRGTEDSNAPWYQKAIGHGSPIALGMELFGFKSTDLQGTGAQEKDLEESIKAEEQRQRQVTFSNRARDLSESFDTRLSKAQEEVSVQKMPDGLTKNMAEIHLRTKEMIDGFDKEAKMLEEAAAKITNINEKKNLLATAAEDRAKGKTFAQQIEAEEDARAIVRDNERKHREFVAERSRQESFTAQMTSMTAANDSLQQRLGGDDLGAARTEIEGKRQSERDQAIARYHAAAGRITGPELEMELQQIDRRASLQDRVAERTENVKIERLQDDISNAGIVSGYARRQQEIAQRAKVEAEMDPAHSDLYERRASAQEKELEGHHERSLTEMRDRTQETWLRASGRTDLANTLALDNRMKEELAQNEGDPEEQKAIREKYAALKAEQNMPHFSETSMRSIYGGVLKSSLLSGFTPKNIPGIGPAPGGAPVAAGDNPGGIPADPWGNGGSANPVHPQADYGGHHYHKFHGQWFDEHHNQASAQISKMLAQNTAKQDAAQGGKGQDANAADAWKPVTDKWDQLADKLLNGPSIFVAG